MIKKKNRIILFGEKGFVASKIKKKFIEKNYKLISLGRKNFNLFKDNSKKINKLIKKNDVIIFVSAIAPCKSINDLIKNVQMLKYIDLKNIQKKCKQFLYVSSDAVYLDSKKKIDENSEIGPSSYHGTMHSVRERILRCNLDNKLTIVRPTLIYGSSDPHNGYGPNQFMRNIKLKRNIKLFGNGEEKRDHIHIQNVVELIYQLIKKNLKGVFNAISGQPTTFAKLASDIIKMSENKCKIEKIKRNGPMPHDGIRVFSNKKLIKYNLNNNFIDYNTGLIELTKISL